MEGAVDIVAVSLPIDKVKVVLDNQVEEAEHEREKLEAELERDNHQVEEAEHEREKLDAEHEREKLEAEPEREEEHSGPAMSFLVFAYYTSTFYPLGWRTLSTVEMVEEAELEQEKLEVEAEHEWEKLMAEDNLVGVVGVPWVEGILGVEGIWGFVGIGVVEVEEEGS